MTYLLTYDLDRPGQNYAGLFAALTSAGGVRILLSTWLLNANETSEQVRDRYQRFFNPNDRVFVCHVDGNWTAANLISQGVALGLLPL
jgi:hypothetical protein